MRAGQLAYVACVLAAGCAFTEGGYGGSAFRCPDGRCPSGFTCEPTTMRCLATTGADGGPAIDATIDAAPAVDATVVIDAPLTVCERAAMASNADRCPAAATAPGMIYGTTVGYASDLAPQIIATCTGALENGPDAIYRVDVAAGKRLTASLFTEGWDGALYILTACNSAAMCADGSNAMGTGSEMVMVTATAATTYYVVVDATTSTTSGCFTLDISVP